MGYCSNCGANVDSEDRFCSDCGTPIEDSGSEGTVEKEGRSWADRIPLMSPGRSFYNILVAFFYVFLLVIVVPTMAAAIMLVSGGGSTATSTPTDAPQVEPTDTPSTRGHQMNESFVVGSGDKKLKYNVTDSYTLDRIGGQYSESTPSGTYLVVTVRIKNVGRESVDLRTGMFELMDDQGRTFSTDFEVQSSARSDPIIRHEPITYDQLNPGLNRTGVVIYDVPPGSYGLLISPAGIFSSAKEHIVYVGDV